LQITSLSILNFQIVGSVTSGAISFTEICSNLGVKRLCLHSLLNRVVKLTWSTHFLYVYLCVCGSFWLDSLQQF